MLVLPTTACHFLSDSQTSAACKTGLEITIRDCWIAVAVGSGAVYGMFMGVYRRASATSQVFGTSSGSVQSMKMSGIVLQKSLDGKKSLVTDLKSVNNSVGVV